MNTFTLVHVAISFVGILSGFIVVAGMLAAKSSPEWTALFLISTVAISATGFFFPFNGFTPALGVGIVSLVVLAVALYALYAQRLAGAWRWVYVVSAVFALYLNCFVLVVQAFLKVPALKALAPAQAEPPFAIAQGITLLVFVALGIFAMKRSRIAAVRTA